MLLENKEQKFEPNEKLNKKMYVIFFIYYMSMIDRRIKHILTISHSL